MNADATPPAPPWRDADLPAPVSGQRHEIAGPLGRLTYYSAGPEADSALPIFSGATAWRTTR